MRIICPDCDAQYEVPDDAIPADGRDVQCSNCGTTWFFAPSDVLSPTDTLGAADSTHEQRGDTSTSDAEGDIGDRPEEPLAPPPRRELDPKVAEILRAEAKREAAARALDSAPESLEYQPELALTPGTRTKLEKTPSPGDSASAKPANAGPVATRPASARVAPAAPHHVPRRNRFPDIEEVNSTLSSNRPPEPVRTKSANVVHTEKRRGFRGGFLLAILISAALFAAYHYAADIAQAVPEADPWLSNYVTWIDEMRARLDTSLSGLLEWLDAQIAVLTE